MEQSSLAAYKWSPNVRPATGRKRDRVRGRYCPPLAFLLPSSPPAARPSGYTRRMRAEHDSGLEMTAVQRRKAGLYLVTLVALMLVFAGLAWRHFEAGDDCESADRETLISRYPALAELAERQRQETERLLALQRAQDMAVNVELGRDRISPEEALRLSLNQVNEIASLRKMHQEAFIQTCRELSRR